MVDTLVGEEPATETEILHKLLDEYDIRTRPDVESKLSNTAHVTFSKICDPQS